MATAAYIHLPFCRRRCFYCDFAVFPVGDRLDCQNSGIIRQYLDYLTQEIAVTPPDSNSLSTVFLGGGTPSLLSPQQIESILQTLDRRLGIAKNAEISLEIDPGTFDTAKLRGYLALGINRFSMGVQAFQDDLLKLCGRSHSVADIWEAIAMIEQVGIDNWSLDLISGLPTQTIASWQSNLHTAVTIAPPHISTYDLIVEPQTAFARYYQPGTPPLPDDETTAAMYQLAATILTQNNYQHYEISNYAGLGYQCQHNRTYWENRPYYGFGMGAASYIARQRFTRPRKTQAYYQWVENLVKQQGLIDCPVVSVAESLLDKVMLGLRLAEGINIAEITAEFGSESVTLLQNCLSAEIKRGWVSIESGASGRLRLTDPQGFLFSNSILSRIFSQLE